MQQYEQYKDSGIAWLGEVPSHWIRMPMKFSLAMPITDGPHETPEILSEGIPFISAEAVKNDKLDFNKKRGYISEEDNIRFSKKYFPLKGDIYMVKSGATTGNVAKVETDEVFNIWSPLAVMRPNKKIISTDFLFYVIKSDYFNTSVKLKWNMGTQQNIGMGVLSNINIFVPSTEEQTAIATYLDSKLGEIDRLISKQETLLEKLAEQRTAIITHTVTKGLNPDVEMKNSGVAWLGEVPSHWEVKRLKFLGDIVLGLTYSPENITNEDNGILVLRSSNIQNGKLEFDDNVFVNSIIPKKMLTTEQDILICSRNGSRSLIGKCALIDEKGINQTFGAFMTVYRTPYRKFIYYILNSDIFKSQLGLFLTSTINQLTTQVLGNLNIAFPPLAEQTAIATYLDEQTAQIDRLSERVRQVIDSLKSYRSALITQAVTGKIKVI